MSAEFICRYTYRKKDVVKSILMTTAAILAITAFIILSLSMGFRT
jgi:hypothetical protein